MTAPRPHRGALRAGLRAAAAALGLAFLALFVAVTWHVLTHGRTPPIVDRRGKPVPGSVASLERMQLGSVPQSVLIRGRSRRNPVVLFLHGGPGMPAMFLAHA